MEEHPQLAPSASKISDRDLSDVHRPVEIHAVRASQLEAKLIVSQADVGNQRRFLISKIPPPARILDPAKLAVGPNAKVAFSPRHVIVKANVRVVEITNQIVMVEVDQHRAVAHGQISRHLNPLKRTRLTVTVTSNRRRRLRHPHSQHDQPATNIQTAPRLSLPDDQRDQQAARSLPIVPTSKPNTHVIDPIQTFPPHP